MFKDMNAINDKGNHLLYVWQRISVKALQASGLKSGLPTSLFSRGCLMGSLELAHSLSGAAFLEITCLWTSLMGCL